MLADYRPTELHFKSVDPDTVLEMTEAAEVIAGKSLFAVFFQLVPVQINVYDSGQPCRSLVIETLVGRILQTNNSHLPIYEVQMSADWQTVQIGHEQVRVREKAVFTSGGNRSRLRRLTASEAIVQLNEDRDELILVWTSSIATQGDSAPQFLSLMDPDPGVFDQVLVNGP